MLTRRSMLAAPALIGGLAPFGVAARAASYPSGSVKLIVNFPAGGSLDTVTRALAQKLQLRLGEAVVVEDRPGASGMLGTGVVAKAAPDGLTLLSSASALAANPTLFKSLPFDTLKDLQAVSLVFRTPLVLVVNPNLPVHSIKELIALLKEKPGPNQLRPRRPRVGHPSCRRALSSDDPHQNGRRRLPRRTARAH